MQNLKNMNSKTLFLKIHDSRFDFYDIFNAYRFALRDSSFTILL
jgi:hypothetical protein